MDHVRESRRPSLSKPSGAGRVILAGAAGLASLVVAVAFSATEDQPHGKADQVTTETKPKHTNGLIDATSPYLLQHAHNPVDWQEWGPAALERARKEDKPIFLSIGYSACHWCHVMAHESFENEQTAAILNEHFVCIKVDREERPDIDEIYMQATVMTTGSGGWPMSVFTTSDGSPFFCGTYFPRPQFEQLLQSIAASWRDNRSALLERGGSITARLQEWANEPMAGEDLIPEQTVVDTANTLVRYFDTRLGGLRSDANKFPPSMAMELMLRAYLRSGNAELLEAVELTLTKMGRGGIYDHLGGGICRYSTDPRWLVPHFEKMLYDQALVASIYLDAYQLTRNAFYAEIARGILDYVIGDLQSADGGIRSTRDADSEGMEGKYYIWTVEQVEAVLGAEDAKLFNAYYDVTAKGNWFEAHGHAPAGPKNILNIQHDLETVAKRNNMDPAELDRRLGAMRAKMLAARSHRVAPGLDDKILTGWNGLMIASFAKGAVVLDEPKYAQAATRAADFVLGHLRNDGKLLRSYRAGKAHLTAYLSDYAFLTEGLINLYEATFDPRWLKESIALTDDLIKRYHDGAGGGFYFTAVDGERLVTRTKDANDGAVPSGNSVQALNLLRLALLTGKSDYRTKAESIFRAFASLAASSPGRFDRLLCAVDFYHGRPKEIAIVAQPDSAEGRAMWRAVHDSYRPNKIVAGLNDGDAASAASIVDIVPLLANKRRIDGKATAYVCRNYKCKRPVTSVGQLVELLGADE